MKDVFKEYNLYNNEELKQIWDEAIFVIDTNVLLNMYRYRRETVKEFFGVFNKLKKEGKIWIPYQVGLEFHENRFDIICELEESYDKIIQIANKTKSDVENNFKEHPFLDIKDICDKIETGLSKTKKEIENQKSKHPQWIKKDEVLENINKIFEGSTGKSYSKKQLEKIMKEGEERYENKIPPGFKDNKKIGIKKFGDLIIWKQILDKAKEEKKPVIFVSGDIKEDWWLLKKGKRIMPHPSLRREFYDVTGMDFHIYTEDRFLKIIKNDINKKTIDEIIKLREIENEKRPDRNLDMINSRTNLEKITHNEAIINLTYSIDYLIQLLGQIKIKYHEFETEERIKKIVFNLNLIYNSLIGFERNEFTLFESLTDLKNQLKIISVLTINFDESEEMINEISNLIKEMRRTLRHSKVF